MIRVNLLPVRAAKKKEMLRFQLTVAGLVTVLVIIVSFAAYFTVRSDASQLNSDIAKGKDELDGLKKKIGELSKIKEQKAVVEEKLKVINKLEAGRSGPTKLFDSIAESMPEKMWLIAIKEDVQLITIKGYATSDEVVADFMRGLQKHKDLTKIELDVAQKTTDKDTGTEVVSFDIRAERVK
jgi:type IV pilus assembly protein PilN